MTRSNHLTEIESCYQGGEQIATDSQAAIGDKSGDFFQSEDVIGELDSNLESEEADGDFNSNPESEEADDDFDINRESE